jgi:hypothetical protein
MRSAPWILALLAGLGLAGSVAAEELKMAPPPGATDSHPGPGMSMDKVDLL